MPETQAQFLVQQDPLQEGMPTHASMLARRIPWAEEPSVLQSRVTESDMTEATKQERALFSSVTQSCPTLRDPMDHSTPGLPVHHQLPESTLTHLH